MVVVVLEAVGRGGHARVMHGGYWAIGGCAEEVICCEGSGAFGSYGEGG